MRRAALVALACLSAAVAGCGQKGPLIPLKDAGNRNLPVTTSSPMSSSTGTAGPASMSSTSSAPPASSAKP